MWGLVKVKTTSTAQTNSEESQKKEGRENRLASKSNSQFLFILITSMQIIGNSVDSI